MDLSKTIDLASKFRSLHSQNLREDSEGDKESGRALITSPQIVVKVRLVVFAKAKTTGGFKQVSSTSPSHLFASLTKCTKTYILYIYIEELYGKEKWCGDI